MMKWRFLYFSTLSGQIHVEISVYKAHTGNNTPENELTGAQTEEVI